MKFIILFSLLFSCSTLESRKIATVDESNDRIYSGLEKCFQRAKSSWTSKASAYNKKISIFSVLYSYESLEVDEAGQSLSSSDLEYLSNKAVELTSFVPQTKSEKGSHKKAKISFCEAFEDVLDRGYIRHYR